MRFQKQGYPCAHAIRVVLDRDEELDSDSYVQPFLTRKAYVNTYSAAIFPAQNPLKRDWLPDFEYSVLGREYLDDEEGPWAGTDLDNRRMPRLQPPETRQPAGRLKNRRIRSRGETPERMLHCSRCGATNHNRRTCTEPIGADPDDNDEEEGEEMEEEEEDLYGDRMDDDVVVLEVIDRAREDAPQPSASARRGSRHRIRATPWEQA
jgi:hypothetical protein